VRLKRWQFWVGLIVSLFFMWLALRGLRLEQVWEVLKQANYAWLIPGVVVYFLAVWGRAWRWHYLLRPIKQIPTTTLFPVVCIGYMGNNIYPARAGELLRAYVLKRKEQVSVATSLATIVIERVFDGVVMLAFVFLNLAELARVTGASGFVGDIRTLAIFGTAAFLGFLIAFLLMAAYPEPAAKVAQWVIQSVVPQRFREGAQDLADRFLIGLVALRSPRDVVMVFATSVVIWLFETGKYWFLMQAFPFEVSFFALMLMNGIVNLATTIPSAPGYIGTFDAPGIAVLQAYGVEKALAAGYTLVLHVALWVPITLLGFYYMIRESLSWQTVQSEMAGETTR
jgi:uncharacterized protein (TIRG00374 family)